MGSPKPNTSNLDVNVSAVCSAHGKEKQVASEVSQ